MKERYETPCAEVVNFEKEDVIITSSPELPFDEILPSDNSGDA